MRRPARLFELICSLGIAGIALQGAGTVAIAGTATVTLPDGKTYEVKVKGGMPVRFKSKEIEVSDLALHAAVEIEREDPLPFSWMIFAQVLAQGTFVVKVTTPLDESASTSFEFTGPGKLAQGLFDCATYPKVCVDLDKPGTHWYPFHFAFEPRGGAKGFELDQWARMDHLNLEELQKTVAQAKSEFGGTPAAPATVTNPKARVYVYRDKGFVGCGLRYTVWCDEVPLAKLSCGKYFIAEIQPGSHTLRSDIASVTVSLEFEAGKSYFLRTDMAPNQALSRGALHVADDSEGQRAIQSLLPLPRKDILDSTMVLPQ
jgi:hypothetical protein